LAELDAKNHALLDETSALLEMSSRPLLLRQ
jgi:hypothetical protein